MIRTIFVDYNTNEIVDEGPWPLPVIRNLRYGGPVKIKDRIFMVHASTTRLGADGSQVCVRVTPWPEGGT